MELRIYGSTDLRTYCDGSAAKDLGSCQRPRFKSIPVLSYGSDFLYGRGARIQENHQLFHALARAQARQREAWRALSFGRIFGLRNGDKRLVFSPFFVKAKNAGLAPLFRTDRPEIRRKTASSPRGPVVVGCRLSVVGKGAHRAPKTSPKKKPKKRPENRLEALSEEGC